MLLKSLEIYDLCLAINMHQLPESQPQLYSSIVKERDDLRQASQIFEQYGMVAQVEQDKMQFTKNLIDQQYKNFKSIPLYKPFECYKQIVLHPKLIRTYVTVEQLHNVPKIDTSSCTCNDDALRVDLSLGCFSSQSPSEAVYKYWTQPCEHQSNRRLRLFQQSSGGQKMSQVQPDLARNAKKRSIVSFWRLSGSQDFICYHSFLVPYMVTQIYKGHNDELFFFNRRSISTKWNQKKILTLQVMKDTLPHEFGENSRKIKNNCFEHLIPQDSHLYLSILGMKQQVERLDGKGNYLSPAPTLI